jgi:hypothetical protein
MMENTHRKREDDVKKEKYINRNLHTPLTKYLQATCWEKMLWNV